MYQLHRSGFDWLRCKDIINLKSTLRKMDKIDQTQQRNYSNSDLFKMIKASHWFGLTALRSFQEMWLRKYQTHVRQQLQQRSCFLHKSEVETGPVNNNRAACHTAVLCNLQASTKFGKFLLACVHEWERTRTLKKSFSNHICSVFFGFTRS